MRKLLSSDSGTKSLQKPEKLLFNDSNLMFALGAENADIGTIRETFASSQLVVSHSLLMPNTGDLMIDNSMTFEIGGKKKSFSQIKDIENSFVLADGIEIGFGNKIPLWLLGLLY